MDTRQVLTTVAASILPLLILLCNFLFRRWSSKIQTHTSHQSESSHTVDSSASITSPPDSATTDSDASFSFPTGEYDVFLSFRGPDTRHEITDVLYHFLVRSKIRTFKDDEDLRAGEGIWPNLAEALKESKIYVPIFSETYAQSKWCLKELAQMVEFHKHDNGHIILPIFYKVDPRDVRKQSGPYEEAFNQHQKNFDAKTVQNWKDALREAGELKGWHVTDKDGQGAIADGVFETIWSHLSKSYELMTDELVGIDEHLKAVVERLDIGSKGVTMVGIHGIGGIGKTIIATAVYNKICARFDGCCFVENVRETLQQREGIVALQNKIISSIVKKESFVSNVSEGIHMIRDRVSHYKVLIVLDDVDEKFKFIDILGKLENFVSGSRFIITSRNTKVLSLLKGCRLYEVEEMSHEHSLQLFCKHAFRKDLPPGGYVKLSEQIVAITGGLPLTIKVVGSLLFEEDREVWEEKILRLREVPQMEVLERLKISYDALDYEAKQIFLDIACLFAGENKEIVSYMWNDCKLFPVSSINVLTQRSMIKIGNNNELLLHDQLRDLGRAIVREEDIEHPWMRSRIWSGDDAFELLHNKKGTDKVRALRLVWLPLVTCEFRDEHFSNLSDLRYLQGDYIKITGNFSHLLQNLRWLQLHRHEDAGDRLTNFHMTKLVILDLRNSYIRDNWGGWSNIKMAKNLKFLNLSYCRFITKFPDLTVYERLEHLDLSGITGSTQELYVGNLRNMKVLRLENCTIGKIVGGRVNMLAGLRELDISRCRCDNLGQFLESIRTLSSLKILRTTKVKGITNMELPSSLKELSTSSSIANVSDLENLERLTVEDCDELAIVADPRQKLPPSLIELHVDRCPMLGSLPSLDSLKKLTTLGIVYCPKLQEIEGLGKGMRSLGTLRVEFADSLIHLDGLENLSSLTNLTLDFCHALERLHVDLVALKKLRKAEIMRCPRLTTIFGSGNGRDNQVLDSLQELRVGGCRLSEGLPHLSKFPSLTSLDLSYMDGLVKLEGLDCLEELQILHFANMRSLESLPSLSKLQKLRVLYLQNVPLLQEIEGLADLKLLERLTLSICKSLERLPDLCGLHNLKMLDILYCPLLEEGFLDISCLKNLERLSIRNCSKLRDRMWVKQHGGV